jgi:hypothetical protein
MFVLYGPIQHCFSGLIFLVQVNVNQVRSGLTASMVEQEFGRVSLAVFSGPR